MHYKKLILIQGGGAVSLPLIMVGQHLGATLGFMKGFLALLLGNFFLMLLSVPMSILSREIREPTSAVAERFFGKKGQLFCSLVLTLGMFGWFAIQVNVISESLQKVCNISVPSFALNLLVGLLITMVTLKGIERVLQIAKLALPLFVIMLFGFCFFAPSPSFEMGSGHLSLSMACMVIGSAIAGVTDLPTYFRFAKSKKDAVIAGLLLFGLVVPLVELAGLYIGSGKGGNTFVEAAMNNALALPMTFFVIFSGFTINNLNLYSATINSQYLFPRLGYKARCCLTGALATTLCLFNFVFLLEPFLDVLGVLLSSMAGCLIGVFLIERLIGKKVSVNKRPINLLFWLLAALTGFLSPFFSLTGLASLDSFVAGLALGFANFYFLKPEVAHENA